VPPKSLVLPPPSDVDASSDVQLAGVEMVPVLTARM
jgi:hypothetical protein